MSREHPELFLVEDNPGDARLIREMLNDEWGRQAFTLETAGTVEAAVKALQTSTPELVLLDLSLPDSMGLDTFRRVQAAIPSAPLIVLTGNQDRELGLSAVKEGAQDYLIKNDLTGSLLVKAIRYASERKQIEASLRVNEARFRSLAELSSDWYWEQDAQGRLTFVSEGLRHKSGIDPARLIGHAWWDIEAFGIDGGWGELRRLMSSHAQFKDVLLRFDAAAAQPVWLSISGVPVASDRGAFAGYRGVGEDVSARVRVDAALRDSEERYRNMMDSARDGILMFDADGAVTFANLRLCSMLGYDAADICGRQLADFVVTAEAARGDGADIGSEQGLQLRRKDGSTFWTMQAVYPVTARDGSHAGTLSIFTDLSEFQAREERVRQLAGLAAKTNEAERANLDKSRFLATVSHDLRQPIHAMGMFVEDLKNARLSERDAGLIVKMEAALELTNSLLDSILVMSSLESGRVTPNVLSFPVHNVLSRVYQAFGPVAEKKGLRLSVVPSDVIVRSDPALLERIVFNLLSNAIKYTDEGGVVIGCRSRGDSIEIQVWDTGLGIPDAYREAIFKEFFRIEGEERRRGGLGLGLAIVQSCAALLGHPIGLVTKSGSGSRFSVTVPRSTLEAAAEPVPVRVAPDVAEDDEDVTSFQDVAVLVVDDDQLLLDGTTGLLRRWGCNVLAATTRTQAHRLMDDVHGKVDLIVSDLRLTEDETGLDLIGELRGKFDPALPALILTGDRSVQVSREIKSHGLMALYKPAPPARLRTLMNQLLHRAGAA